MTKRTCTMDGCDVAHQAKGYCKRHYNLWYKNGTAEVPLEDGRCTVSGCLLPKKMVHQKARSFALPYCQQHFSESISKGLIGRITQDRWVDNDRFLDKDGYVHVRCSDGKFRLEHRVVMEKVIGRPLAKNESPHHKNGNRADNSESNLELWVGTIRYGQRASDLICPHCGICYAAPS